MLVLFYLLKASYFLVVFIRVFHTFLLAMRQPTVIMKQKEWLKNRQAWTPLGSYRNITS